jgi:hypothetical protein
MGGVPLTLTYHPLQRVGAFALAALAGAGHPEQVTDAQLGAANDRLTADLLDTAPLTSAKDAGGWLMGLSYGLWPNSPVNLPARAKWDVAERRRRITQWRTRPSEGDWPEVPCWLSCGRRAVGLYGKRDIPGRAAVGVVNDRQGGMAGDPTCWPCLVSLWAWPYGGVLTGSTAIAAHSWDDDLTGWVARRQVAFNAPRLAAGNRPRAAPGQGERDLVDALRALPAEPEGGVDVTYVDNNNREPKFYEVPMTREVVGYVRGLSGEDLAVLDRATTIGDARWQLVHTPKKLFQWAADRLANDFLGGAAGLAGQIEAILALGAAL